MNRSKRTAKTTKTTRTIRTGLFSLAATAMVCLLAASTASAVTIAQHVGNNNPTTEGWVLVNPGAGTDPILSPITADAGHDAWEIDDTDASSGKASYYDFNGITTAQADDMIANGFQFAFRLKIPATGHNKNTRAIEAEIGVVGTSASKGGILFLGTSGGDPHLDAGNYGAGVVMTGLGEGYHDYLMTYDSSTDMMTTTVDGNLAFAVAPNTGLGDRVWFGSVVGSGEGLSRWSDVTLTSGLPAGAVVPEPATMGLLGLAGLAMMRRRRLV